MNFCDANRSNSDTIINQSLLDVYVFHFWKFTFAYKVSAGLIIAILAENSLLRVTTRDERSRVADS